jgi:hypothetical protein
MAHAMKTKLLRTVGALDLHESTEGNLYVTANGGTKVVGGAWGPAADNDNWFAWREPADPTRPPCRPPSSASRSSSLRSSRETPRAWTRHCASSASTTRTGPASCSRPSGSG